jgi:hypothetical protein
MSRGPVDELDPHAVAGQGVVDVADDGGELIARGPAASEGLA